MTIRVAPSCRAVLTQANALWPNRSKASDGTIGNERHQRSKSDHNPDEDGIVHAVDLTHDPAHGCDAHKWVRELMARRDPRVLYVISNGQKCSSDVQPWKWRKYDGENPHEKHVHVSIKHTDDARHNTSSWFVIMDQPSPAPQSPNFTPIKIGDQDAMRTKVTCSLAGGRGYVDIPGKTPDDIVGIVAYGPDPQDSGWDDVHLHFPEVTEADPQSHTARIVVEADKPVDGAVTLGVTVSGA